MLFMSIENFSIFSLVGLLWLSLRANGWAQWHWPLYSYWIWNAYSLFKDKRDEDEEWLIIFTNREDHPLAEGVLQIPYSGFSYRFGMDTAEYFSWKSSFVLYKLSLQYSKTILKTYKNRDIASWFWDGINVLFLNRKKWTERS